MGRLVKCESDIGLSLVSLEPATLTPKKDDSMSLYECNMHGDNLAHGSLGHAIKHRQVIGSHMTFNVQY